MPQRIRTMTAEKLLGMQIDLLGQLQSGALTINQFERFLKGQNPFTLPPLIKLGTFKSAEELLHAVKSFGATVSDYAEINILRPDFIIAEQQTEIEPVIVRSADLGFTKPASREAIYERATSQEFGFLLCPAELGPQLRLQYVEQLNGESLIIAMEPIVNRHGSRQVFYVGRYDDGESFLFTYKGDVFDPNDLLLFLRPRK